MNYRNLDPKQDWNFFMSDHAIPANYLSLIRPIEEESARTLWRDFVSLVLVSPALLPADAWPSRLLSSASVVEWRSAWNSDQDAEFVAWLRSTLAWPDTTSMLFTWSDTESVETSWEVFRRYWRCFLFADEGPILWSLQRLQAVRFMSDGLAYAGERLSLGSA